jgi:hypothetical protein
MNQLLTRNTVDTPSELMRITRSNGFHHEFIKEVELKGKGTPHSDTILAEMAYRPAIFAAYVCENLRNDADRARAIAAVTSPTRALNIVSHHIELYADFADLICSDLETVEQMVSLVRREPGKIGPVAISDLLKLLETDPNRLVRAVDKNDRDRTFAGCVEVSEKKKFTSAAWAFFWLSSQEVPDRDPNDNTTKEEISPQLIATLAEAEEYAYRGMLLLRNRVATVAPDDWSKLRNAIVSPRWMFHALCDGLWVAEEDPRCFQVLCRDPEWLVQYLAFANVAFDEVAAPYKACALGNLDHPLFHDLNEWYSVITAAFVQPPPEPFDAP